jgi:hypothetical protein
MILVECKNWDANVDASSIRDFAAKLRRKRQKFGLLFCGTGITGAIDGVSAAHDEIRQQFSDDIQIVTFSRAEVEAFRSEADFISAARRKLAELIFRA